MICCHFRNYGNYSLKMYFLKQISIILAIASLDNYFEELLGFF
jgi:hypothetical protein